MPTWIIAIIVVMFVLSPLANSIAKAIETRSANRRLGPDEDGALRIGALEEHVQLLNDQMHELAEQDS